VLIDYQLVAALRARQHVCDYHEVTALHGAVAGLHRRAAILRKCELAAGLEVVVEGRTVVGHDLQALASQYIRHRRFAAGAGCCRTQGLDHLGFSQVGVVDPVHRQRLKVTRHGNLLGESPFALFTKEQAPQVGCGSGFKSNSSGAPLERRCGSESFRRCRL
jgi:hypothetical protein